MWQADLREPGVRLGQGEVVLIVEDQLADRTAVQELLASAGFSTIQSGCSGEAMLVLGCTSPDLVLLASESPEIDGPAVLRMMRSNRRLLRVPVVMTKPQATVGDKVDAIAAGASALLAKPFAGDELLAEVGWQLSLARPLAA